jgi:hypothetical protein
MKTNKNIDELFELARNQKSLFSKDEIKDILNNNLNTNPQIIRINVKPRIGILKMATALSSFLVIVLSAFFIFNDSAEIKQEKINNPAANGQFFSSDNKNQEGKKSINSHKKIFLYSGTVYYDKPVYENNTKFIELNNKESEKLGVFIDEKEKSLKLISDFDGEPTLVKLTPDWGAVFEPINKKLNSFKPVVLPKLITDSYGFRRIAFLNDYESISEETENNWMLNNNESDNIQLGEFFNSIQGNLFPEPLNINNKNIDMSVVINPNGRKKIKIVDKKYLKAKDDYIKAKKKFFSLKIPKFEPSEYDTIIIPRFQNFKYYTPHLDLDSLINWDYYKKFADSIKIDTLIQNYSKHFKIFSDSLLNFKPFKMQFKLPKFKWNYLDSLIEQDSDSTEIFDFELILPEWYRIDSIGNDLNRKKQKFFNKQSKFKDIDLKNIYNASSKLDINKLLPVKVPINNKSDADFHFILWYEPTDEFLNLLPDRIVESLKPELKELVKNKNICRNNSFSQDESYLEVWRSCNGAISNMSLYPNPASSKTTLSYTLSEPRELELSLYNLIGQKIAELRPTDLLEPGKYEEVLDTKIYPPGLYLIVLKSNVGEKAVQRLLIQ